MPRVTPAMAPGSDPGSWLTGASSTAKSSFDSSSAIRGFPSFSFTPSSLTRSTKSCAVKVSSSPQAARAQEMITSAAAPAPVRLARSSIGPGSVVREVFIEA